MAKKNKDARISPFWLFGIAAAFLSAGWLMKSFPILIFAGLAPVFAITDRTQGEDHFWDLSELILLALVIACFAAHRFEMAGIVISLVEAILLTLAFIGYCYSRQQLGNWVGKPILIFFWLAIEYLFLNLPWRTRFIFLGDALVLKSDWMRWTQYTGYLGSTLWILMANLFLYFSVFCGGKIKWGILAATIVWIAGPVGLSLWQGGQSISRADMISMYNHEISGLNENYVRIGEVVPAVSTGISVLILLVAVTRNKAHW